MTWFKRILWVCLALVILLGLALAVYVNRSFPAVNGELKIAGLKQPVTVARDAADVTHIKAQSAADAWFAIGYVHAQERGWQLEFNRRVMHGELSEAFGAATLETDKLLRTLGILRAAERQWQALPAEGRDAMQAYSDGINAFYGQSSQALSPEFHILRVKPGGASAKPWTPQDSLGWSLMMALDLGGNWGNEFARLSAARGLSTDQLWQLFPPYPGEQPASKVDFAKLYSELGVYKTATPIATPNALPNATKTGAISQTTTRARSVMYAENGSDTPNDAHFLAQNLAHDIADWARSLGTVMAKGLTTGWWPASALPAANHCWPTTRTWVYRPLPFGTLPTWRPPKAKRWTAA